MNWSKMPQAKVSKSLWKDISGEDKLITQPVKDEISKMFAVEETQPKKSGAGSTKPVKEAVPSFLDPKRANNVGLLMGRITMSTKELQRSIASGDKSVVKNEDMLRILQQVRQRPWMSSCRLPATCSLV